jgi:hypothetical protein
MQENTTVEQTTEDTVATTPTGPQFTLQDLLLCAQVIALTTQRGAFKAEELTQVGGLYDRLVEFLSASGALTTASSAPTSDETTSTTATDSAEEAAAE